MNAHHRSAFRCSVLVILMLSLGALPKAHAQGGCDNDCAGPTTVPEVSSTDLSPVAATAILLGGCALVVNKRHRKAA
jgi:hypothetical protein